MNKAIPAGELTCLETDPVPHIEVVGVSPIGHPAAHSVLSDNLRLWLNVALRGDLNRENARRSSMVSSCAGLVCPCNNARCRY